MKQNDEKSKFNRVREARVETWMAVLLSYDWDRFNAIDRRYALDTAEEFGAQFAAVHDDAADRDSYVDVCVWWAYNEKKVINDVEFALWESASPADPRVKAFAKGCRAYRAKKARKVG